MAKRLLVICTLLCLDLFVFVLIYESNVEDSVKASTTFYENVIALTFDDGPHGTYTKELLEGLKKREVVASFFILGEHIEGNEELLLQMKEDGHLIGNHTFNHSQLTKLGFDEAVEEINTTNAWITNISGYTPEYIRPPFGSFTDELLSETSMSVVMWNVDPLDWKYKNKDIVTDKILKNVKNGDIILMHDIFESSVDAAQTVIKELKKQDYVFVTVDKMNSNKQIIRRDK